MLAGFARALAAAPDEVALGQALCGETGALFDARAVYLARRDGALVIVAAVPPHDTLDAVAHAAADWAFDRGRPAGRGSDTLPAADWLFVPVGGGGTTHAVLGLGRDDNRDPVRADLRGLLSALVDQAGLALARIQAEREMAGIAALEERDRLRSALLASVGHDLRSPLTTVVATAADLRQRYGDADPAFAALSSEAARLQRFVTNLLDMARIEAGALKLDLEPVDLTDAVASAVQDVRLALAGHAIQLDVPPDLPLVRADARLLHHCLINLLDNAGKFGAPGTPIGIVAARTPDRLTVSVVDEGPGLPPGFAACAFDRFARLQLKRGGQRVATAVTYLNDCPRGGATVIPQLGVRAMPILGNSIFFSYACDAKGNGDSRLLHGGEPVEDGEKWVCTLWMRQAKFA